jgi:hypothetical protein
MNLLVRRHLDARRRGGLRLLDLPEPLARPVVENEHLGPDRIQEPARANFLWQWAFLST